MQPVDQRNQKGRGLAAAGLGGRDDVVTTHDYRDRAGLYRRRVMMAAVTDGTMYLRG
jgi:hypothetical protein